MTSIRCHTCNEMGHKASQCPYATNTPKGPSGYTPQQVSATVGEMEAGVEGEREGGTDGPTRFWARVAIHPSRCVREGLDACVLV